MAGGTPKVWMALVLALGAGLAAAGTVWAALALFPDAGQNTLLVVVLVVGLVARFALRRIFARVLGPRG